MACAVVDKKLHLSILHTFVCSFLSPGARAFACRCLEVVLVFSPTFGNGARRAGFLLREVCTDSPERMNAETQQAA